MAYNTLYQKRGVCSRNVVNKIRVYLTSVEDPSGCGTAISSCKV